MKVTVNNTDTNTSKPFPKLMEGADKEIFYFFKESVGLPIANFELENSGWGRDSSIATSWDMSNFTDFHGSITLSND